MMCYIAVVQDGAGGIREVEVEARDATAARRYIHEQWPALRLVRLIPALWRSR